MVRWQDYKPALERWEREIERGRDGWRIVGDVLVYLFAVLAIVSVIAAASGVAIP